MSFSQAFSHLDDAVAKEKRRRQEKGLPSSNVKKAKVAPMKSSVIVNRCQKNRHFVKSQRSAGRFQTRSFRIISW